MKKKLFLFIPLIFVIVAVVLVIILNPPAKPVAYAFNAVKIDEECNIRGEYKIELSGYMIEPYFGDPRLDLTMAPFDNLNYLDTWSDNSSFYDGARIEEHWSGTCLMIDCRSGTGTETMPRRTEIGFSPDFDRWVFCDLEDDVYYVGSVSGKYAVQELYEYFAPMIVRNRVTVELTEPTVHPTTEPTVQPTEENNSKPPFSELITFIYRKDFDYSFELPDFYLSECKEGYLYYFYPGVYKLSAICDEPVVDYTYDNNHMYFVKESEPERLYSVPSTDLSQQTVIYESDFGEINDVYPQGGGVYKDKVVTLTEGNKRMVLLDLTSGEITLTFEACYIENGSFEGLKEVDGKPYCDRIVFNGKPTEADRISTYYYWIESKTFTEMNLQ